MYVQERCPDCDAKAVFIPSPAQEKQYKIVTFAAFREWWNAQPENAVEKPAQEDDWRPFAKELLNVLRDHYMSDMGGKHALDTLRKLL